MQLELSKKQVEQWIEFKKLVNKLLLITQKESAVGTVNEEMWRIRTNNWTTPYTGSIGGLISIELTPTGLGTTVKFTCKSLGLETNVTEYDNW